MRYCMAGTAVIPGMEWHGIVVVTILARWYLPSVVDACLNLRLIPLNCLFAPICCGAADMTVERRCAEMGTEHGLAIILPIVFVVSMQVSYGVAMAWNMWWWLEQV